MKAVVFYESFFGNTQRVAEAISKGLGEQSDVSVLEVSRADYNTLKGVDLLVVGGPTHIWSMSRPLSRRAAAEEVKKETLDRKPILGNLGVREWLDQLPNTKEMAAATYDTRMPKKGFIPTSIASRRIASKLKKHGYRLVAKPEGFIVVDMKGPLLEGELERATEWGRILATEAGCHDLSETMIDQILMDSFPASDPPAWTLGREHHEVDNREDSAWNG